MENISAGESQHNAAPKYIRGLRGRSSPTSKECRDKADWAQHMQQGRVETSSERTTPKSVASVILSTTSNLCYDNEIEQTLAKQVNLFSVTHHKVWSWPNSVCQPSAWNKRPLLLSGQNKNLICTAFPTWEGGFYSGRSNEYVFSDSSGESFLHLSALASGSPVLWLGEISFNLCTINSVSCDQSGMNLWRNNPWRKIASCHSSSKLNILGILLAMLGTT